MGRETTLEISRLGAGGDGVGEVSGHPVYIAGALPGDQVLAEIDEDRGRLIEVVTPSPDRGAAVCKHFGVCGGCAVQQLSPARYDAWKREKIQVAFGARGLDIDLLPTIKVGCGARRRVTFAAVRTANGLVLGFHESRSHQVVDVEECPVTAQAIVAALPTLRQLAESFTERQGQLKIVVTQCQNGLDVGFNDAASGLAPDLWARLAGLARDAGFLRVTVNGNLLLSQADPIVEFGKAKISLPLNTFLQAAKTAEQAMVDIMMRALPKRPKHIVDLFCGLGAFTFPLAERCRVSAFDGDRTAIESLQKGAQATPGIKPITAKYRDLFTAPLSRVELKDVDVAVFDPPRAGAKEQARNLAKSKIGTVVAVSCNPATLARDLRELVDGGYALKSVVPIDQFVFSPHVEVVAVLHK